MIVIRRRKNRSLPSGDRAATMKNPCWKQLAALNIEQPAQGTVPFKTLESPAPGVWRGRRRWVKGCGRGRLNIVA